MGRGAAAAAAAQRAPATSRRNPRSRRGHARVAPGRGHKASVRRLRRAAAAHALPAPLPVRLWEAPFARSARARTSRALDTLLSGRGWIALVFLLLAGIVFFNVDLLQMNRDIARNADKISALKRQNARLLLSEARLASSERIQEAAAQLGFVLPAPGEVRYLKARPTRDAGQAVKRITAPNLTFVAPEPVAPEPVAPTIDPSATADPAAADPAATTTPADPAATAEPAPITTTEPAG